MTTWSSSAAQPIHRWQQGSHFPPAPYQSGFLHGGMQRPNQSPDYSESLLQFQDELSGLMMGNVDECEPQPLSDLFGTDTAQDLYRWTGDTQWCDNLVSPSINSIMTNCSEYAMSSLDSTAASPQEPAEPTSPEPQPWKMHQINPHIRRDSVNDMTTNSLPGIYSQYENYNMSFQHPNLIQGCEDQKVIPAQVPNMVAPTQFNPSPTFALDVFRPAWSVNPEYDPHENVGNISSPHAADPSFHRIRWLPEGARHQSSVRAEQDKLIIEGKRRNMSYKEIKEHYKIEGAVSTLRGRYRAAVKPKNQRVRKPEWKPKDLELLALFVNQRLGQGKIRKLKNLQPVDYLYIPWKSVVQDIADNGGSYHFGPSAAKKRFVELVNADRAREEGVTNRKVSASNERSRNALTESVATEKQLNQYSAPSYELRSQTAQEIASASSLQTNLQMSPYPLSYDHKGYQSTSQVPLSTNSCHGLPALQPFSDTPYTVIPSPVP